METSRPPCDDETMTSFSVDTLAGVIVGGGISLVGVWIQGRNERLTQKAADNAALAKTHWLHQRKLQEKTYFRLARMVLDVYSHLSSASSEAQDGGVPELLRFEVAQRDAATKAVVEVQVYASPAVKKLWAEWLAFTTVAARGVGRLVDELRSPLHSSERIAAAWNQIGEQQVELTKLSHQLLDQMNQEMTELPKLIDRSKASLRFRRNV